MDADGFKALGNDHFRNNRHQEAADTYSQALALKPSDAVLFGNRSACFLAMQRWAEAEDDAKRSLELDPHYLKGYFRFGSALFYNSKFAEANAIVSTGLHLDPGNGSLMKLQQQIQRKMNNTPHLYPERLENESSAKKFLRRLMELLENPSLADSSHELQGTFKQLINPASFMRLIYPGLNHKQTQTLPQSLKELLQTPIVQSELESSMTKIESKAESVLAGVKQRGKLQGDVMDTATEELLRPQILQEAFARELLEIVQRINQQLHTVAHVTAEVASPSDPRALLEQLDDAVVDTWTHRHMAVQESYLGHEWAQLFMNDVIRLEQVEGLQLLEPQNGRPSTIAVRWLEVEDVRGEYPALAELIDNMHALRYELNHRCEGSQLSVPATGSTLLVKFNPAADGATRAQPDGVNAGFKLTCAYHLLPEAQTPAQVVLTDQSGSTSCEVNADQLMIYDSTQIRTERTVAVHSYYCLYSFAHEATESGLAQTQKL